MSVRAKSAGRLQFHRTHAPNTPGSWSLRYFASTTVGLDVVYALAAVLDFEVRPRASASDQNTVTNTNAVTNVNIDTNTGINTDTGIITEPSTAVAFSKTSSAAGNTNTVPKPSEHAQPIACDPAFVLTNDDPAKVPTTHAPTAHADASVAITDRSALRSDRLDVVRVSAVAALVHKTAKLFRNIGLSKPEQHER